MEENIKKVIKSARLLIVALVMSLSFASNAFAYIVVYGDGTTDKPYRISSCAQLESWLNGPPGATLLNLNFLITNNLDCTGLVFDNTTFLNHVSIDGGNHKITNLKLGGTSGLVYGLDNSTIKNLWLANGDNDGLGTSLKGTIANQMVSSSLENVRSSINLTCGNFCGGLVGWAQDSSITRAVYAGTLITGHSSGGLVGSDTINKTSNLTISKSAFLGTMSSQFHQNCGGIIGALVENVSIEDSYVDGTLLLGPFSGGMIGAYNEVVVISRSYVKGIDGLDIYSGGLLGGYNNNISVLHSYSATPSDDYLVGAVEGDNNGTVTYNDVHYLDGIGYCQSDNASSIYGCSSAGSYMPDSLIFSLGWNFTDVWKKEIGENPTLKLTDFNDPADIPNNGDMNGDGIKDTFQANIELLKNNSGHWTAIETKDCTTDDANLLSTTGVPKYTGYNLYSDFIYFNAYCLNSGQSFTTNIYLDRNIDTSKAQLLFYNPTSKTYTKMNDASFSHKNIGGQTFTVISYTLTDGGPYDLDGVSNGKIVDPVVLVNPETSAKNNSMSSRNSYSFLSNTWTFDSSELPSSNNDQSNNNSKQDTIKKPETKNPESGLSKAIQENIIFISLSTIVVTYIIIRLVRKK